MKAGLCLFILGSGLVGCTSAPGMVRARYAKENGCAESQVHVAELGDNTYTASGCGEDVSYVCTTFAGGANAERNACARRDGTPPRGTPGVAAPRPEATLDPPH